MNELAFIILMGICLCVFLKALSGYEGILQFPFLAACDLLFFMGPQFYFLLRHKNLFKPYGETSLFTFMLICLLFYSSSLAGYYSEKITFKLPNWKFNKNVLISGLFFLSAIAMYGKIQLAALPDELTSGGQWTGLPVRYVFFATVGTLCIPLGIVLLFKYKNKIVLIPLLLQITVTLSAVIFKGRRSPALFTGLMVLTGLWFAKRIKIPTGAIIAGGIGFILFVTNVGAYRSLVHGQENVDWKKVRSEVFSIKKTISGFTDNSASDGSDFDKYVDVMNGVVSAQAAFSTFGYNYGASLWNELVHSWVPGQLVGHDLKKALKFKIADREMAPYKLYKYKWHVGSCIPGYAELFVSFGLLGMIFMYYMGKVARMVWEQAMTGNLIAQTVHFALAPFYIRFGGGGLWTLLSGLIFWVIFLLPIYVFAKRSSSGEEGFGVNT